MIPSPHLFDQANRAITLSNRLGIGGEGSVFEIASDPNVVAKVYHKPASKENNAKLKAMVALANPSLLKVAAWPTMILRDRPGGSTVGLVMPKVKNAKEIHTLYSPAHRKMQFPHADWTFLIHTAVNCAIAFDTLHAAGVVMADVNQSNLFVTMQALVTLIDCDSFQISHEGRIHGCEVGVPLFTPPELQNRSFRDVIRTPNHDLFGLAVLIFQLLFVGRHPFAGYVGPGDMPIEQAISEFRYAYGTNAGKHLMRPPPGTLPLSAASANVTSLFERAFCETSVRTGSRPTAREWIAALDGLRQQLGGCRSDPGHVFPRSLSACPWCDLISKGAPNYFISVAFSRAVPGQAVVTAIDISVLWKQIEDVRAPRRTFARPSTQSVEPTRLPRNLPTHFRRRAKINASQSQRVVKFASIVLALLALPLLFKIIALSVACLATAIFCAGLWLLLEHERKIAQKAVDRERRLEMAPLLKEIERREAAESEAEEDLLEAERSWNKISARFQSLFAAKLAQLRDQKQAFDGLQQSYVQERQTLQHNAKVEQFELFLQQNFISDQEIDGIGRARLAALESYGIETAFDVIQDKIFRVPGFGEKLTERLLAWRRQVETRFVFDAKLGVPIAAQQALDMKFRNLRQHLELKIQNGLQELTGITKQSEVELGQCEQSILSALRRVRQAKADLSVLPNDD